jgi:hypothetical protein
LKPAKYASGQPLRATKSDLAKIELASYSWWKKARTKDFAAQQQPFVVATTISCESSRNAALAATIHEASRGMR